MSREDDLLEQATRALRAEPPPTKEELADGRAVLMWAQRGARKKQRGRTLRWILPLAAVLAAGSALAATGQIERMAQAVTTWIAPERVADKQAKRQRAPKAAVAPKSASSVDGADANAEPAPVAPAAPPIEVVPAAPLPEVVPPTPARAATPSRAAQRPARPRPSASAASAEPAPAIEPAPTSEPEPTLKPSPDLAAYRKGHALHFRARDFKAALAAWDAYLEAYPHGTFAIEAIYNRAICLLRLGRKDEARRALTPFAEGAMQGGYRRAEATQLLKALE